MPCEIINEKVLEKWSDHFSNTLEGDFEGKKEEVARGDLFLYNAQPS